MTRFHFSVLPRSRRSLERVTQPPASTTRARADLPSRARTLAVTAGTVAAVLATAAGCASGHRTASPPSNSVAAAQPATPLTCAATVTTTHPAEGAHVGVVVSTVANAQIRVIARGSGVEGRKVARAGADGQYTFWYRVSSAVPGSRITLHARVSKSGRRVSCTTWLAPGRKAHVSERAPTPAKAAAPAPAPAPPPRPAAWCTATATVYNAYWNENNVYVHSN
jgi:hypothetical protein